MRERDIPRYVRRRRRQWQARPYLAGDRVHLGFFASENDAEAATRRFLECHRWRVLFPTGRVLICHALDGQKLIRHLLGRFHWKSLPPGIRLEFIGVYCLDRN